VALRTNALPAPSPPSSPSTACPPRAPARSPSQIAASLTSPRQDTHSASAPSGTNEYGRPGATFRQAPRVVPAIDRASGNGGE
jgi:hypothetical protein